MSITHSCEPARWKMPIPCRHIQNINEPFYLTRLDTTLGALSEDPCFTPVNTHSLSLAQNIQEAFPSWVHVFLLTRYVFQRAFWYSVMIDATETFGCFWTNWIASLPRAVSFSIFTSGKFKWNEISKIKNKPLQDIKTRPQGAVTVWRVCPKLWAPPDGCTKEQHPTPPRRLTGKGSFLRGGISAQS